MGPRAVIVVLPNISFYGDVRIDTEGFFECMEGIYAESATELEKTFTGIYTASDVDMYTVMERLVANPCRDSVVKFINAVVITRCHITDDYSIDKIREMYDANIDIARRKNADYSNSDTNPFRNFCLVGELGVTSVERGIMVRMCDKISRINNLQEKKPDVIDESIEDTISDLVNYTAILGAYLEFKDSFLFRLKLKFRGVLRRIFGLIF